MDYRLWARCAHLHCSVPWLQRLLVQCLSRSTASFALLELRVPETAASTDLPEEHIGELHDWHVGNGNTPMVARIWLTLTLVTTTCCRGLQTPRGLEWSEQCRSREPAAPSYGCHRSWSSVPVITALMYAYNKVTADEKTHQVRIVAPPNAHEGGTPCPAARIHPVASPHPHRHRHQRQSPANQQGLKLGL